MRIAQALQVVDQLNALFTPTVESIAQAELEESLAKRQRARAPRSLTKASTWP